MDDTKELSINLELSLDGCDYYEIDELDFAEKKSVEKAMSLLMEQLGKLVSLNRRPHLVDEDRIYLRLNHSSGEKYRQHFEHQKELYDSLTKKEKIILCFIGRGHQQKHIAFVLGITPNTFRTHQKNIYRKMHFHNKVQMAVWCDKYLGQFFKG